MAKQKRFPEELYRLIPAMYPHFVEILHTAGITGPEFFVLSHIKHAGKEIQPGVVVMPISEIKDILVRAGQYTSTSGAHGFITNHLQHNLKYLEHRRVTPEQKRDLFPSSTGYRDVVTITQRGFEKLDEVNREVERLFQDTTTGIPEMLMRTGLSAFSRIASLAIRKLNARLSTSDDAAKDDSEEE